MGSIEESDDYVPRDYDDLVRVFAPAIARQIDRVNRRKDQSQEIFQHTLLKIMEVDILKKYAGSSVLPRTMTGDQAAAYCGVTFARFKVAIWRGSCGDARNKAKGDMTRTVNASLPKPIKGGWSSKKAIYMTADIHRMYMSGYFRSNAQMSVTRVIPASKVRFRAYLLTAVTNTFKNYCRTIDRKYKDTYPGDLEDGTPWELTLVDNYSANPETLLECRRIEQEVGMYESGDPDVIKALVARGHSVAEIKERVAIYRSFTRAARSDSPEESDESDSIIKDVLCSR